MKRKIYDKKLNLYKEESKPILFCEQCAEEMQKYAVVLKNISAEEARKQFNICKEKGRFKGEFCARLFIAENKYDDNYDYDFLDVDEDNFF